MDLINETIDHLVYIFAVFLELTKNVFGLRRRVTSDVKLDGKVVLITGANTGIGKETALQLSKRGAKIIIGCRDLKKGEEAVQDIKRENSSANINVLKLDLSSLTSVRQLVKTISEKESKIDILINNAGVMRCPEWQTEDGFEMQFGTNHLGHFLLTLSLMPLLRNSSKARVITVSSTVHMVGKILFSNINLRNKVYTPSKAYNQSKLANVLFTRELAKRLGPKSNVNAYCLHPGIIRTDLWRHLPSNPLTRLLHKLIFIDSGLGAQTSLYCALEKSIENESGFYYNDCKRVPEKCMLSKTRDDNSAKQLWELSSDLVKLEDHLKLKSN